MSTETLDQVEYGADGKDTLVAAERIIIKSGAQIRVRNGTKLVINAETLVVEGPALIDGSGEVGERGAEGPSNDGYWDNSGTGGNHRHWEEAGNHPNDRGHKGGTGGPGGRGAVVEIFHAKVEGSTSNIRIIVAGGAGGPGGPGGVGRRLKCVHCNQEKRGSRGPNGDQGPLGTSGSWRVVPRSA